MFLELRCCPYSSSLGCNNFFFCSNTWVSCSEFKILFKANNIAISDLKLRDVKLVATYQKWTRLLEKMSQNQCHGCIKLEEHLKLAKEIKKHEEEVYALQFQMSDEALKQMPDFQGRV